jgi:hypothetical protein
MTTSSQCVSQSATALDDRLAAPAGVDGPAEGVGDPAQANRLAAPAGVDGPAEGVGDPAQARSSANARASGALVFTWPSPQASLRVLQFDEEPLPSRFALVLWQRVQLLWQSVQLLWQSVQLLRW